MTEAELHTALREVVAIGRRGGYDNDEIAEKLALVVHDYADQFRPCEKAPIGIVTNCVAMDCESDGCAIARPQVEVSLDDLR